MAAFPSNLPKSVEEVNVKGDGWCIYRALLKGLDIEDTPENVKKLVSDIQEFLNANLNNTDHQIGGLTLDNYITESIKDNRFGKNQPGNDIKDTNDFIAKLGEPRDKWENGPKLWGDAEISAYVFSRLKNRRVKVYEYSNSSNKTSEYKLKYDSSPDNDSQTIINILRVDDNHYKYLKTVALAAPTEPPAASAAPTEPPAASAAPTEPPAASAQPPEEKKPTKAGPGEIAIRLGEKSYSLKITDAYQAERERIFKEIVSADTPEKLQELFEQLDTEDGRILTDVGFTRLFEERPFYQQYAVQMGDFFKYLPDCTTETEVMLRRQCTTSYYLIYSLLHLAAQEGQKELKKEGAMNEVPLAMTDAAITDLTKVGDYPDEVSEFLLKVATLYIAKPGASAPPGGPSTGPLPLQLPPGSKPGAPAGPSTTLSDEDITPLFELVVN